MKPVMKSMTATALEVPLLDLGAQTRPIHDEVMAAIAREAVDSVSPADLAGFGRVVSALTEVSS